MDRRTVLRALVALSAGGSLSSLDADASPSTIDTAWQQCMLDPVVFAVDDYGTIWLPGVAELEYRHQAFNIAIREGMTEKDFAHLIEDCPPLAEHLSKACMLELEKLEERDDHLGMKVIRRLERKVSQVAEGDEWRPWLAHLSSEGRLDSLSDAIRDWLGEGLDETDYEHVSVYSGPQGEALSFFESLSVGDLTSMGVRIVEGDHPGSTYFAAELDGDVDQANARAALLGWPITFRSEARW